MMTLIVNRPKIEWVGGEKPYILMEEFTFRTPYGDITVPAFYRFNGASVPRIPFIHAMYGGKALEASCPHDYGYEFKVYPRNTLDKIFRYLTDYYENPSAPSQRTAMYLAVRLGGWSHW